MLSWIKNLFRSTPREALPARVVLDEKDRPIRVIADEEDPVRDEVLRRAFFSDGPVFATRNPDGTVTFSDGEDEETVSEEDLDRG